MAMWESRPGGTAGRSACLGLGSAHAVCMPTVQHAGHQWMQSRHNRALLGVSTASTRMRGQVFLHAMAQKDSNTACQLLQSRADGRHRT